MSGDIDETALFIRNIPRCLSEAEKLELFNLFKPNSSELIGRDSAKLRFLDPPSAKTCLQQLHQTNILDHRLNVKYARREDSHRHTPAASEDDRTTDHNGALKILQELNFNHPPPPELRYKYPTATRETIQSIASQLLSNCAFYTQVLHLMNRMNLPPPFNHHCPLTVDSSCQTDEVKLVEKTKKHSDLCTDESELSDEDPVDVHPVKRLKVGLDLKRYRVIIDREKETRSKRETVTENGRRRESLPMISRKDIKLLIPTILPTDKKRPAPHKEIETKPPEAHSQLTPEQISSCQLSLRELQEKYPIFQKYDPGTPSNVLYIKNLAKTVTVQDLELIYNHFAAEPSTFSVDLKTAGRLRGQAFVRFSEGAPKEAEKALQATNGYLLKEKPLCVCFSKSGAGTSISNASETDANHSKTSK